MTPLTILGIFCVLFITWCSIFPWWATKYHITFLTEYSASSFDPLISDWDPPMPGHPLGIAQGGWDVLARAIWSSRYSMMVAFQSVFIGFTVGIIVGVFSAFVGGWVDNILMRITDVFMLFPSLLLAFLFITIWGNEMETIMIALAVDDIPVYARIARASTLQEKSKLYVDAGRTSGASNFKLMFKHILPNAMSPLIVRISFHLAIATLSVGGLAFLGFAVGKVPTWGFDIGLARRWMLTAPHAMFWPGVWIFISALGFQLVGDGLRDALDPKLRVL
jgi:peptide/nickel transport system permease protein